MFGWFVLGLTIGSTRGRRVGRREQRQRDEARAAEREARIERRRSSLMPAAVWWAYGVALLSSLFFLPLVPVALIVGVGIWVYADRRRQAHVAWKAEQAAKAAREARRWRARCLAPLRQRVAHRRATRHATAAES